ncbi:hypothetical protein [Tanticharoenia sakaeratensis]|uniref:Tetratricopeptide repeat protein n=1 Tax=Tanticharoenia sakaeratensis NBRC 103193 TaxID=1231623 RepID=A0A0D6MGR6_9PROT|nr:hypothetical protein [Tanticharoenia sakaeratensis]GAN52819.1 hypothetical protein Tasa_002_099 [Tanticharoenia sakaeratensis NBRC 103193]GBQ18109.1 hypothetical protein AA103193_0582 [Tanticharoenia sakaeratensis NBRC 103193]
MIFSRLRHAPLSVRPARAPLLAATILAATLSCHQGARAADELSMAVGKPLQQAQTALAARDYTKAMAGVNAADAVAKKTDYESYTIAQMRAAVAAQSGDTASAIKAYDVLIASPRTPAANKPQMLQAEISMAYSAKNYPQVVTLAQQYLKKYPDTTGNVGTTLVQAYYLQNDYANAAKAQQAQIDAEAKAGKKPTENQLQFLATCYTRLKDSSNETHAFVQLVQYYPKPEYWANLIHGLMVNPKIPPQLQFDIERIRLATGVLRNPSDYMDMTERAVQAGLPQLALKLMNQGYANGALGHDAGADREARLHAMVIQRANADHAKLDANAEAAKKDPGAGPLLTAGYDMVLNGQVDEGLALMREGMTRHPLHPEIAQLDYGLAQMDGGRTADAIKTLQAVTGDNGPRDIAAMWALLLQHPPAAH